MQGYVRLDENDFIIGFSIESTPAHVGPVEYDTQYVVKPYEKRKYENGEVTLVENVEYTSMKKAQVAKRVKEDSISKSFVTTTTGKVFDGDEKSQDRMIRAISIAGLTGETVTEWKMYDNTIIVVTLDELKEAVIKAGKSMSNIWLDKTDQ